MDTQRQENVIRYIAGGTIGEPNVLRALTDASVVHEMVLEGYGLRMQPLEDIQQGEVREDL